MMALEKIPAAMVDGLPMSDVDARYDLLLLSFRNAMLSGRVFDALVDGMADEFEDESGINTGSSSGFTYDSANDLYTFGSGAGTLLSVTRTASETPDVAQVALWLEDVDAITLGTDLRAHASSDGGTTWDEITLSEIADLNIERLVGGTVPLTGAGTTLCWKIEAANSKAGKLHAVGLLWG